MVNLKLDAQKLAKAALQQVGQTLAFGVLIDMETGQSQYSTAAHKMLKTYKMKKEAFLHAPGLPEGCLETDSSIGTALNQKPYTYSAEYIVLALPAMKLDFDLDDLTLKLFVVLAKQTVEGEGEAFQRMKKACLDHDGTAPRMMVEIDGIVELGQQV